MPHRVELSKTVVERLPVPEKGSAYVYDSKVPSLAVCITANGVRTFYRVGRVHGRYERIKLGRFGEITVQQARELAAQTSMAVQSGKGARTAINTQAMTLGALWQWYLANHAKPRKRTWQRDERRWNAHLLHWQNRPIVGIARSDVRSLHATLRTRIGPYGANHVLEQLRHMLQQAVEHEWIPANPAAGIKRFDRTSRERFLTPDELPRFLAAVDKLQRERTRDFFRVLLFTGARRGNVAAMRWDEIDIEAGLWRIPDTKSKNKRSMVVVLPPQVVEILKRRRSGSGQFVFPGTGEARHYQWPREAWRAILANAGLENLRIHDLRRTLASWQVQLGANIAIIGESLGHRSLQSTAVYARTQIEQVRASVNAAVAAMIDAEKASKE